MADGTHPGPSDFRLCEQRDVAHSLLAAGTCSPCVVSRGGGDRQCLLQVGGYAQFFPCYVCAVKKPKAWRMLGPMFRL